MDSYIAHVKRARTLIRRHEFRVKKKLGQHFMVSPRVLQRIIELAEIQPEDRVLEIGPGLGALTQFLAEKAQQVVAVEIDTTLLPLLRETLAGYPQVQVVQGDILQVNLDEVMQAAKGSTLEVNSQYKVVGNLPYYITSPIVMKVLEGGYQIGNLVMLVQKEVAQRMAAKPATKEYGLLSVAVQFYAEVYCGGEVPRDAFWPQPEVESALVKLVPRKEPPVKVIDRPFFFWVARAAFGQRRKTLLNALVGAPGPFKLNREEVVSHLINLNIDPRRRGETLNLAELAEVSNRLYPILGI